MERNIRAEYGLEFPQSKLDMLPKMVEHSRAKILLVFQIQAEKQAMANQTDIVMLDKLQKKAELIDGAVPRDSTIKKKEDEKLKKHKG